MPDLDEFGLISRFFKPLTGNEPGALGLTDDAAVLSVGGGDRLAVTVDTVIEGVHFLPSDPPETIGAKASALTCRIWRPWERDRSRMSCP